MHFCTVVVYAICVIAVTIIWILINITFLCIEYCRVFSQKDNAGLNAHWPDDLSGDTRFPRAPVRCVAVKSCSSWYHLCSDGGIIPELFLREERGLLVIPIKKKKLKKNHACEQFHTTCSKYAHASRGESWLCETQYCCKTKHNKKKESKKRSQSKCYNRLRGAANAWSPVGWVTMWNGHSSFCFTDAWSLWALFHRLKHSRPARLRWLLLMHWATLTNALTAHCNASA